MARTDTKVGLPHLFSALTACGLAAAILFTDRMIAIHLEQTTLPSTASELFAVKTQGLVFQRAAVHARDVLPLYGSSELLWPKPARACDFFRTAPTGFQVSPVGKPGTTSLIILQKLAALGSDLRGKKLAISISPGWFVMGRSRADWYEGSFSLFAANQIAFGSALDFELKRDIASRMLQFPRTLAKSPLLGFALRRLASGRWFDQVVLYALWPLGKIQNAILDLQDHFAALAYLLHQTQSAPRRHPEIPDWPKLMAKAGEGKVADKYKISPTLPANFVVRVNSSPEWMDLELLLHALARIHARPLLLSMPMDGQSYNLAGISRSTREAAYYKKMRALAQRYNFALVEFEEDDDDPAFLDREHAHLTAKGWVFYNRVLDDFFHNRTPESDKSIMPRPSARVRDRSKFIHS